MTYTYLNPGDKRDTPAPLQQDDSQIHNNDRDLLAIEIAALRNSLTKERDTARFYQTAVQLKNDDIERLRSRVLDLEKVVGAADKLEVTASVCLQSLRDAKKRVSESVLDAAINAYLDVRETTR